MAAPMWHGASQTADRFGLARHQLGAAQNVPWVAGEEGFEPSVS